VSNRLKLVLLGSLALGVCGCADASDDQRSDLDLITITAGLEHPWGMAFLPDGRILVTERVGSMRIVSADGSSLGGAITGIPAVNASGQGGLLDVAIDPDFSSTPGVYVSYSEDSNGSAGTAVARGQLSGNALVNLSVIFRQAPKISGTGNHYGSRLVFAGDKTLYVTLGERAQDDPSAPTNDHAQNLAKHLGKVVRMNRDGSVPGDNPFVGTAGALPHIYSYGHRNPQGAALHPQSGELWLCEHGPQGGDEVNRVLPGRNYGWPQRSYGCPYGSPVGTGCQVNGGTHAPGFEEPLATWIPTSTAPSGMMFYSGSGFPEWQGSLFVGALAGNGIWRFPVNGNTLGTREQLFTGLGRIRDVRQGPDGWIYLLTDGGSGQIVRIQR
jgi:glucose/arabinose dehydrogenase